ncbi:MAG: helix-turn-helix domain-containing protein, partial [Candidatus Nanoarchaeia archaeon]
MVQQLRKGMPVGKAALAQKISRVTVWEIRKKFERDGLEGLKTHKPGRLFEPLNAKC